MHIAKEMEVGKTQIQTIVADKAKILALWDSGSNAKMKLTKVRKTEFHELNERVFEWFCDARAKHIPVSDKLIQEKAVVVSMELGLDGFNASNEWLDRFQKRHNISCAILSGEGAAVDMETVQDWRDRLEGICQGYSLSDIFNADETGLFYRALPTRSHVIRGDQCTGGKNSKERICAVGLFCYRREADTSCDWAGCESSMFPGICYIVATCSLSRQQRSMDDVCNL